MDERDGQSAVGRAREATLGWLDSLQAQGEPAGVLRISPAHDPARWPGMLLPGTCHGLLCRHLLDATAQQDGVLAAWLLKHRRADGVFRIPGMREADLARTCDPEEAWRGTDFQVTSAALAALEAIEPDHHPLLGFAEPFLETPALKAWLADRDLRDPRHEGRVIAKLGAFLLALQRFDDAPAGPALHILFRWHDQLQEPSTGFWGVGQHISPDAMLNALTGAAESFHLWYAVGRRLPYQARAIDQALSRPAVVGAAVDDVALVDVLSHGHALLDHRRAEIEAWLGAKLAALLAAQSADGGFAEDMDGVRRISGCVSGYEQPQGASNTVATSLRWTAIALAAATLWPGWREWRFRRAVGFGYRKP